MTIAARPILSCSMLALGACAGVPTAPATSSGPPIITSPTVVAAEPQASAHDRLFKLFKDSDEASLQRNPLQALYRGDMRFADRLGDLFSDAHYQAEKAAAERDLAALGLPVAA